MILCKACGSSKLVKDGLVKNKQRYLCKECAKTFKVGDDRERHSLEKKIKVVKLYTEGIGLKSISRIENVSSPFLAHWIRSFAKMIREKLRTTEIPDEVKNIEILEIDEPMCGLLWTETGIKLLISR